jgi:hypothetical protein
MMSGYVAPSYLGLGPRFGIVWGVWYLHEAGEFVAIVEEEAALGHWWILYHHVLNEWVEMGAFISAHHLIPQTFPLFAEMRDMAISVNPLHTMKLVVENGPYFRWWVVHGTSVLLRGPLVGFVAPQASFCCTHLVEG